MWEAHRSFRRIWKERDSAQPELLEKILERDMASTELCKKVKANRERQESMGLPWRK